MTSGGVGIGLILGSIIISMMIVAEAVYERWVRKSIRRD